MPTIQAAVSTQELIRAVEQLSPSELDDFVSEVIDLRARRLAPSVPDIEAQLLHQVAQGVLPEDQHHRYHELHRKLQEETLTPDDHADLLRLSDESELRNSRRMEALVMLAQLQRRPLQAVMEQLGIRPCSHE